MWKLTVGDLVKYKGSDDVFLILKIVARSGLIPPNHVFALCSSGRRFCDSVNFFHKNTELVQRLGDVDATWKPGHSKSRH